MLVLLASPDALGDVFSNVGPASQVSGLSTEFALGNYALDSHFSAISVGLFSGINVSGVPPMIAYFLANALWQLTSFLASTLITLFTFAFSLDLVNGSAATNGAGALAPVSSAIHTIYTTVFGPPWLTVAIVITGMWAMWKALVQRRYVETAGALSLSLIYVLIALAFVTEPQATIGSASKWTNEMSSAFLSLTSQGNISNQQQAKQADADQLFSVLVFQPWVVLQFGGIDHCVTTGTNHSVGVQPLTAAESQALANGTEIQAGGRTCINNANKYASHFLRYSPDANDRTSEYNALANGDTGDLPSSDPSKASGSYKLGPADEPAAAVMGQGGQYQRLLLAIVIFIGELGAFLLLGVLSVAVILSQVILLLLLAFSPVALVIGMFPGRGHEFFVGWLTRLATFLLRKAVYSLILAVLLAVAAALNSASAGLGWLMSFGLEATFFWAVFLYRNQLTSRISLATTGHAGNEGSNALKLAYLYTAARAFRIYGGRGGSSGGGGGGSGGSGGSGTSGTPPAGNGGAPLQLPTDQPPTPHGDTPSPPEQPPEPASDVGSDAVSEPPQTASAERLPVDGDGGAVSSPTTRAVVTYATEPHTAATNRHDGSQTRDHGAGESATADRSSRAKHQAHDDHPASRDHSSDNPQASPPAPPSVPASQTDRPAESRTATGDPGAHESHDQGPTSESPIAESVRDDLKRLAPQAQDHARDDHAPSPSPAPDHRPERDADTSPQTPPDAAPVPAPRRDEQNAPSPRNPDRPTDAPRVTDERGGN